MRCWSWRYLGENQSSWSVQLTASFCTVCVKFLYEKIFVFLGLLSFSRKQSISAHRQAHLLPRAALTGWPKTLGICVLRILEPGSPDPRCQGGQAPRPQASLLLPSLGGSQQRLRLLGGPCYPFPWPLCGWALLCLCKSHPPARTVVVSFRAPPHPIRCHFKLIDSYALIEK